MNIAPVVRLLETLGAPTALIGAHAMAVRGYPRFTADVDLLTTARHVLDPAGWRSLVEAGASIDARQGDADDPLAGVVHILLADATDVDVIVGRWAWQTALVERSEHLIVAGTGLRVPQTSDLILLKLAAGGYIDRQDAAALLSLGNREAIVRDVEERIASIYPDIRGAWHELLAAVPDAM